MSKVSNRAKSRGFTIVELLIVIVIIAILAAITIVAYNGIQQRARSSAVMSDLDTVAKKMALDNINNGSYATTATAVDGGNGLPSSANTTYQFHSTGSTYCVTGTNGNVSYKISDTSPTPSLGGCAGDSQNGVPAITNYAKDPDATATGSFGQSGGSPAPSTTSIASDQVHHGTTSLKRSITAAGTSGTSAAVQIPAGSLVVSAGQKFSWSFWIYSSRAGTISPYADGAKVADGTYAGCGAAAVSISANAWTKVTATCTPTVDMRPTQVGGYNLTVQAGDTVWFDEFMVVAGATLPNYADGYSTDWTWNGTPNGSTSTGPPL